MYEQLKERIKKHEGYRNEVYVCSEGKRTIGYGHLIRANENFKDGVKYPKEQLEELFDEDFERSKQHALFLIESAGEDLEQDSIEVIIEMVYQLGKSGVARFKKMLEALSRNDYQEAARQMLDSRWYTQTPKRCEELAAIMASCQGG